MSGDTGLTELEKSSGCSWYMFDADYPSSWEIEVARRKEKIERLRSERLVSGAKIIAGLTSTMEIQRRLIRQLFSENIEYAIGQYFKKENISAVYRSLVEVEDCIQTLIRGMFYKVCRMPRSVEMDLEIDMLSADLRENINHLIVYERVRLIQRFIHIKVEAAFGSQERISVRHMRNLLAVCRLHLNLYDMTSKRQDYVLLLDELSAARASVEYFSPTPIDLPVGKSFIARWRVRHLQPLSYFFQRSQRERIANLKNIDLCLSRQCYAELALNIYAAT